MNLDYHVKGKNRDQAEIERRIAVKEFELKEIFDILKPNFTVPLVRIAVLGMGDPRFAVAYKKAFEQLLQRPVELNIFDLQVDDLKTGQIEGVNLLQHDCTQPLPNGPFNLIYARVLLKFIEVAKQYDLLVNSIYALAEGGMAVHILEQEDYKNLTIREGCFAVPYDAWRGKLRQDKYEFMHLPLIKGGAQKRDTIALVLFAKKKPL